MSFSSGRNYISCEMCGKEIPRAASFTVKIERSVLTLCPQCYSHYSTRNVGSSHSSRSEKTQAAASMHRSSAQKEVRSSFSRRTPRTSSVTARDVAMYDIVDNYPELVRKGRERMGLSIRDLAQRVRESENVIKRIELGRLKPPLDLARRLEDVLKVKLIVRSIEDDINLATSPRADEVTLGDIVNIKTKERK